MATGIRPSSTAATILICQYRIRFYTIQPTLLVDVTSDVFQYIIIFQKCSIPSIFIRITHQTLPYNILTSLWLEGLFSSHVQQSRRNEKGVFSLFCYSPLTFTYQLHFTSFIWFPYTTLHDAYLVHFTFGYHNFIILFSCHPVLLHSPPHSLHSFQTCWSQQIFIELSSYIRWEFMGLVMREQRSKGWGEEEELITRIQVVRTVFVHRLLLLG